MTTITRTVTVAAGLFAPGHLGELTRIVPFELADAVLAQTRTTEKRLRVLPSRVGLYFVLALALFPQSGYSGVWAKLTAALGEGYAEGPSGKALPNSTWSWQLTSRSDGSTRLVTRIRVRYRATASGLLSIVLMEFGDLAMMRAMLGGLKHRAESTPIPTSREHPAEA